MSYCRHCSSGPNGVCLSEAPLLWLKHGGGGGGGGTRRKTCQQMLQAAIIPLLFPSLENAVSTSQCTIDGWRCGAFSMAAPEMCPHLEVVCVLSLTYTCG